MNARITFGLWILTVGFWAGLFYSPRVEASSIVNILQVGSNVVATGTGTLNLAALTNVGPDGFQPDIVPSTAGVLIGTNLGFGNDTAYRGITGPLLWGSGGPTLASTSTGNYMGVTGGSSPPVLIVPLNYVSGSSLSATATWSNNTFATLNVNPGTYTYSWGSGATFDTFTVQVGPTAVPEPTSLCLGLIGIGSVVLFASCRRSLRRIEGAGE